VDVKLNFFSVWMVIFLNSKNRQSVLIFVLAIKRVAVVIVLNIVFYAPFTIEIFKIENFFSKIYFATIFFVNSLLMKRVTFKILLHSTV